MRRYAQVIQLRPEHEAEYIRYHADVWPTVLKTIAECGIRNYSIFLRSGILFAYFEYYGADFDADKSLGRAKIQSDVPAALRPCRLNRVPNQTARFGNDF